MAEVASRSGRPPLGLIEGFYGRPWAPAAREGLLRFAAAHGYDHYFYAPKADAHLRERWNEPHPASQSAELRRLAATCRSLGLRFGIGLSPLGLCEDLSPSALDGFRRRLSELAALGPDYLGLLFDDVDNRDAQLADKQCALAACARAELPQLRLFLCPTYYSTAPVLERLFGAAPPNYLSDLGAGLAAEVEVFWTGPRVCSETYPADHLEEIGLKLKRRPWLWDNYPVNDGPMARRLHLRGFPPRPAAMAQRIAGLSANPMNQAWLNRLPLSQLPAYFAGPADIDRDAVFRDAVERLLPAPLAQLLGGDLERFQAAQGRDALPKADREALAQRYAAIDHEAAREVARWLLEEPPADGAPPT